VFLDFAESLIKVDDARDNICVRLDIEWGPSK